MSSNIKVGDRVRFLNSTGGGVVTGFKGKDMIMVEDESGFDFPVLASEIVVIGESKTSYKQPVPTQQAVETEPQPSKEIKDELVIEETKEGESLNISLGFLPSDPKQIAQADYEAYLINESNYYLFYNYMNRQNASWFTRSNGVIEPNVKIFIEQFGKESLNDLEKLCLQCIAFKKDKPFSLKNAISVELRLDTVKFYKRHSFVDNDFFEEDALIVPVVQNDIPVRELLISVTELQEQMLQKTQLERRKPSPATKKKPTNELIEIDLHTHAILETTAGMSNSDILNYQLDIFRNTLKEYAGQKGRKIVFIHGKGDGVLRTAIEKELKSKYKSYPFQDASFREYGFGATMVTIK